MYNTILLKLVDVEKSLVDILCVPTIDFEMLSHKCVAEDIEYLFRI